MGEARIVQQNTKWFHADSSLPDVLMAVEFRSASGFSVVAMDDFHIIQSNDCVELLESLADAFLAADVIARHVSVASIDAGSDRNRGAQSLDHFCDLLEAAAQGKFRARGIFDEDGKPRGREIKALRGRGDGGGGLQQSSLAVRAAK